MMQNLRVSYIQRCRNVRWDKTKRVIFSETATDLVGNEVWFEGAPVVRGDFPREGG